MPVQSLWRPVPENEVTRAFTELLIDNEWHEHLDCVVCQLDEVEVSAVTIPPDIALTFRRALELSRKIATDFAQSGSPNAPEQAAIALQAYDDALAFLERAYAVGSARME